MKEEFKEALKMLQFTNEKNMQKARQEIIRIWLEMDIACDKSPHHIPTFELVDGINYFSNLRGEGEKIRLNF